MYISGNSYEEIYAKFRWQVPERFNMGVVCCDEHAKNEPDKLALVEWCEDGKHVSYSYGELQRQSNRLANGLRSLGVKQGDRVGIIQPQSFETVVCHIAIYKLGAIAVPLARLFGSDAIAFRLENAGVSVVLTYDEGAQKVSGIRKDVPGVNHVVSTGEPDDETIGWKSLCDDQPDDFTPVDTGPDTPALIIFTSGTTGPPKGALHGHRVLAGHIPGVQVHHEFMPQAGDVGWTPADWAWAGGLLNILMPCLFFGVPVVFGGLDRFDPERAFQIMADTGVANAFIPPTALRLLTTVETPASRYDLKLRTIGSGGESLGADTYEWAKRELGLVINEFYGQTECNLVLSAFNELGVSRAGAIGKPVPGHRVAVIDQNGEECLPGTRGEVAIRRPDPVMFLEYWQDDEATKNKFIGDWMRTGDQCVMDEEGYFSFVGRDDDIINYAGYRVGPGEIEDCLVSHASVKLAVAVGKPDKMKSEIIKAYVVLHDEVDETPELLEEIRKHAKDRMSANIYPREIETVSEIPLTTTGKVIRRLFRERARGS